MKNLNADIKSGKFKKFYLLYGNESYLIRACRNKMIAALTNGDQMNFLSFSGKTLPELPALREFTDTLPFFAEKRVLLLEDSGLFRSAAEGFDRWLSSLPDTACVIFCESEVDKRNRLYKLALKEGYAAELNHPDERQTGNWILSIVKSFGLKITGEACREMTGIAAGDLEYGKNEMDKLCSYCLSKGAIELSDVEAICSVQLKNRIFDLVSMTSSGKRREAMRLYYDLLALREPPLRILFLILREMERLCMTALLKREGRSADEIAAALHVRPFAAGKMIASVGRRTPEELRRAVQYALELEKAVKTGDLPDTLAAELLILGFSSGTAGRN